MNEKLLSAGPELQKTNDKFKIIFDFSPISMLFTDMEGTILECNQAALEIYERPSKPDLVKKDFFSFVDESYQEPIREKWVEVLKKGSVNNFELLINKKNGGKITALFSAVLLLNVAGKPYSVLAMVEDITERKKAEELVISTKNEWEKTFDNMPDLVTVLDGQHRIIRANKAMAQRIGTSLDEILGLNCFKCMHRLSNPVALCPHVLTLKDGKEHSAEIYEEKLKGFFLVTTTPLFGKDGKITGSIHVARDITEQKKAEERLKTYANRLKIEKVKYEALLSSIGHGVVAVDKTGMIVFANSLMKKFFNKKYAAVAGRKLTDILDLYDEKNRSLKFIRRPLALSLSGKTIFSNNYHCINDSNKKINLSITTTPIFLHKKVFGAIGVYEDITKQKEIDRAKTEFVSLASHQLRTPITEISLSAEMLMSDMPKKTQGHQRKYLKNIFEGVKEMTGLIETLLNISRMQMGTFMVNPKPVNLPALVDRLIDGFSMQIRKKKLILKKQYDKNLPAINLDSQIIQLALENLFSNAIKYTEKGIVGIEINKNGKYVVIKIFDTGCGIPERQKHLVFTKLFRSDNLLKNKTKGHGLGLYIVKAMIKSAGGKIRFESEEGKGTAFYITLPLSGMKKKTQQSLI